MTVMTSSEAFVETLAAHKVRDIFGIVGSAYMDALDLFEPAGIRFIPTVHEQGSAHMADGYSRVSAKHGVCIGQNGPGVTNFVTGIAAAYWAHSPVVVVTPETGSGSIGLGGFQETEQLPIFEKITKYQAHVMRADRMAEFTDQCLNRAINDNGPTQLNIPRDNFYGEADYKIHGSKRIERGPGGEESLSAAADQLAKAEFPVIIAGGGVTMSDGVDATVRLAERISAPVVNSYLHNDSFPASHELWAGPLGYQGSKAGMKLLAKADVVLALGTRLGPFGTLPQHGIDYWPTNAKLIQVDCDEKMLGRVKPSDIDVFGDARAAANALLARLQNRELVADGNRDQRVADIQREKQAWEAELDDWTHERDEWSLKIAESDGGMHPREALRALEKAMPADAMVSTDIGNICSVANSYLRFDKPRSFLAAMTFGNCGYALPAVMGAKVAEPNRPAVAYVGDGAWGLSMMETLTCVREGIAVTPVVFNNRQWGAEKKNQVEFYGRRFLGSNIEGSDWTAIAKAMGADAVRVERPEDLGEAFEKACDAQKHGKTTVIEVMVTRELGEPFRRDALKEPTRYLDKYKMYTNA